VGLIAREKAMVLKLIFSRGLWIAVFLASGAALAFAAHAQTEPPTPALSAPISVYNNWSAYDELSDNIPLTEALAMRELDELLRLKKAGVRFDYYTMDAFWYAPDGGYRTWRTPNWPNGPDAWITKCRANGIKPGLWFGTNSTFSAMKFQPAPTWKSSLNEGGWAMSFSEGGFLPDFMNTLQYWYDRGIRMFKFDFVNFSAATPAQAATLSKAEIKERNVTAFREALRAFRRKNPEARIPRICAGLKSSSQSTPATHAPPTCRRLVSGVRWTSTATTWCGVTSRPASRLKGSIPPALWPARQAPPTIAACTHGRARIC
jgi:hypothetical protein